METSQISRIPQQSNVVKQKGPVKQAMLTTLLSSSGPLIIKGGSSFASVVSESSSLESMDGPMSAEALQTLCFAQDFSLSSLQNKTCEIPSTTSSSECLTENNKEVATSLKELEAKSLVANAKVEHEIFSREGRTLQRWSTDPHSGRNIRLTAGCVPILEDGRILLISSSKKTDWLLPKGGWELDESLEEGAIRECFEEAGVLGILGPKFDEVTIETRKAKRKRLEMEERLKASAEIDYNSGWSVLSQLSEDEQLVVDETYELINGGSKTLSSSSLQSLTHRISPVQPRSAVRVTFQLSESVNEPCKIKELVPRSFQSVDTEETASTSTLTHTHTCLTMFPLFVQQVKESWPETDRKRRAFHIDDAIEVVRAEFKPLLQKVKERGLHRINR